MGLGKQCKSMTFLSAVTVGTLLCTSVLAADSFAVESTAPSAEQPSESAVTTAAVQKAAPVKKAKEQNKSSAKRDTSLWKADLFEYKDSLSLVSYEKVKVKEEKETPEEIQARGVKVNKDETYDDVTYTETNGATTLDVPERAEPENVEIAEGNFGFTTYGYGHGVGLCQNGANHYATYGGMSYQDILQHYYPGTYIADTGTAKTEKISANGEKGSVSDIVSRIVYTEIGSSMNVEAIKAQAIAIYTYIKYYGGSVDDLYPSTSAPQNVVDAVNSVLGQAVYYDGSFALTMFCASSGGSTASCGDVFYEDIPYLRSVESEYDSQCDPHFGTVEVMSAEEVRDELEAALDITLSDDPANWVTIIEGDGGYAAYVVVDNQVTIKGNDFRYYLGLKSPKFTCTYY